MNDHTSVSGGSTDPGVHALYTLAREGGVRVLLIGDGTAREVASMLATDGRAVVVVDERDEAPTLARPQDTGGHPGADPYRWAERLSGETFDVIVIASQRENGRLVDTVRNRGMLARDGFLVASMASSAADDAGFERRGFTMTRRWPLDPASSVARFEPMGGMHELSKLRAEFERLTTELGGMAETERLLQTEVRTLSRKLRAVYDSPIWRARGVVARVAGPVRSWRRSIRSKQSSPAAPAQTRKRSKQPQEPTPTKAGGIAVEYRVEENRTMRQVYEQALAKKTFETEATHVAVALSVTDLTHPGRQALEAVALGRWLDRSGFEVIYLSPERWDEVPVSTRILLSMSPDVDPLAIPDDCLRLAWIRDRLEVWARSAVLILSDGVLLASEMMAAQMEAIYPGPITILRAGVDTDFFGAPTANVTRVGALTTVPQSGRERHLYASLRTGIDYPLAIFGAQRGLHASLERFHRGAVEPFGMPSLYLQAALVLEDRTEDIGDPQGLSGRVLEGLASKALVVSDSTIGLREAHLDEMPTYLSPADLRATVHRYLESPQECDALAGRLHDVVLREHSLEHRANEFSDFVRDLTAPSATRARKVVAFYPHYERNNPYQRMLYSRVSEHGLKAIPLNDPGQLARSPLLEDHSRDFFFHLHWTNPILADALDEETAKDRVAVFLGTLDTLRDRGVRIIWTVHNVLPHESVFTELEAALCQGVADRADLIHVMCEETPRLIAPTYRLPADRVRLIPHGSYVGVYPNLITQERARDELRLTPTDTVLCCFGGIRRYKGIEQLLDAFEALYQAKPESRLLLVGPRADFEGSDTLADRCAAHPGILSNFNRVADVDVQIFLNASDVVVLPQRASLNSGALMLAFSFGRPVVAARTGCLEGMVSPDVGITFDPAKKGDLKQVLMDADRLKTRANRDAAYRKALAYPYTSMSDDFARLIEELLD